jgi:hypothetical protein
VFVAGAEATPVAETRESPCPVLVAHTSDEEHLVP